MRKLLVAIVGVGGALSLTFFVVPYLTNQTRLAEDKEDSSAVAPPVLKPRARPEFQRTDSAPQPVFSSGNIGQSLSIRQRGIVVHHKERDPVSDEWELRDFTYSTSYDIVATSSRIIGEFYIAGLSRWGADIVESWVLSPMPGGHSASKATSSSALGIPAAPSPLQLSLSTDYTPLAGRAQPIASRVELYRGNDFGGIRSLKPDPDGRFILILNEAGSLFRIANEIDPTPELLYTANDIPHLEFCVNISPMQHVSQGRLYLLHDKGASNPQLSRHVTILADANNDGLFESHVTINCSEEWASAGYNGAVWSDVFIRAP